jgi:hypothetical protein
MLYRSSSQQWSGETLDELSLSLEVIDRPVGQCSVRLDVVDDDDATGVPPGNGELERGSASPLGPMPGDRGCAVMDDG